MGDVGIFSVVEKFLISTKTRTSKIWGESHKFQFINSVCYSKCQLHTLGWIYLSLCTENKSSNSRNTRSIETGQFAHSKFSSLLRSSQKNSAFGRDILLWPLKRFLQISRLNQGRMTEFNRKTTNAHAKFWFFFPFQPSQLCTHSPQLCARSIYLRHCSHNTNNHTTSNYPCYLAVLYAEAVRFLVLLFPPIEFFLLSHALLNMTLYYRALSTVSLILPSKEPRTGESVWPKPHKSQKPHAIHPNLICLETLGA